MVVTISLKDCHPERSAAQSNPPFVLLHLALTFETFDTFETSKTCFSRNLFPLRGVQWIVRTNLAKSFVAVVSGNAIYFLLLMPVLPPAAQHRPKQIDLGLILDFWVCLVCYGVVELISRRREAARRP